MLTTATVLVPALSSYFVLGLGLGMAYNRFDARSMDEKCMTENVKIVIQGAHLEALR